MINLFFLYGRSFFAFLYRVRIRRWSRSLSLDEVKGKVSVIIPCYNENVDVIRQLFDSLAGQTLPPYEIIFIDDHSSDQDAYLFALDYAVKSPVNIRVRRQVKNMGKLKAIYRGIQIAKGEYVMFIDADGCVSNDAIKQMLTPLYFNHKVGGTCGRVVPLNENDNELTKMQMILYENAYNQGRQYQSFFNKVLVCSGTISMFRTKALNSPRSLKFLLKAKFSRHERYTGDDIAMTNIVLKQNYSTIYVGDAICYTTVPRKIKDFFVQQLRWTRDAYTSYFEEFGSIVTRPLFFLLETQEVFYWLISLGALILFIVNSNMQITSYTLLAIFIFDLSGVLIDNYYLIFIDKKGFFKILMRHYEYSVLILFIRAISLATIFHRSWAHDNQKTANKVDTSHVEIK